MKLKYLLCLAAKFPWTYKGILKQKNLSILHCFDYYSKSGTVKGRGKERSCANNVKKIVWEEGVEASMFLFIYLS